MIIGSEQSTKGFSANFCVLLLIAKVFSANFCVFVPNAKVFSLQRFPLYGNTGSDGISFFKFPSDARLSRERSRHAQRTRDNWCDTVILRKSFNSTCFDNQQR